MPTKEYIREYRDNRRKLAIKMLGEKCRRCESEKNLQFDHITPEGKVNEISSMLTTKLEIFLAEVQKCQLLCYDCHLEKTAANGDYTHNRDSWKHGVNGYINQKCRCEVCLETYRVYRKERWKREKV